MLSVNKTDRLVFDLRMNQIDYSKEKEESLRKNISDKYGVPLRNVEINFIPETIGEDGEKLSLASDVIENIQDPAFQVALFEEYIKSKGLEDIDFEMIKSIDSQINSMVDFDAYSSYKSYKFKYVKWDNYLSYGKGNFFDFTKLNGLVLLNGQPENQCGKTTFAIDLLRFALFGKAHKSPDLGSVFNIYRPEDTEVMVEACIEIDDADYVIRRTITRPPLSKRTEKSKAKQKIEYFKVINGQYQAMENCVGENGAETNTIIRDSVGSVEDYNLIISATSKSLGDLLEMGQTDKGRLFSRWLGLLSIERKEEVAKNFWKNNVFPKLLSNTYNKATIESEINEFEICFEANELFIKKENEEIEKSKELISEYDRRKNEQMSRRKEVNSDIVGIDITTIENQIADKLSQLETKRAEMRGLKAEYDTLKDAKFDPSDLERQNKKIERLTESIHKMEIANASIKTQIKAKRDEIARIVALIDGGKCPTCGQTINVSEQNGHISEHNKEIERMISSGVANKKDIDTMKASLDETRKQVDALIAEQERHAKKTRLELCMIALKNNIDVLKLEITELNRKKEGLENNIEAIRLNGEINAMIKTIEMSIKAETETKEGHIRQIEAYKNENKGFEKEIKKRHEVLKVLSDEAKTILHWNLYHELVGKNGIVKIVLKRALPVINNEVDRLLSGLCDFKVELSVSDDNKVCIDLVRGGQRMDLGTCASGFETVMASIALRHSLACIATLPKPNFTVLDEVLDGVAVSNYDNVKELFMRMGGSYDFIIHITHNELLTDWHNMNISVTKGDDMVSKIALR